MVRCVVDGGWAIEATAERFQVDAKTVRKWRDGSQPKVRLVLWIGRRGRIGPRTGHCASCGAG